jgi:ectoine hydroxylase-related dioxygenase (phytanoyl-CoA dioxygenase family)
MTMTATDALKKPVNDETPYPLTEDQRQFYRREGFIKLKDVLSAEMIAYYGDEITRKVFELTRGAVPLAQRSTYGKAFLQVCNLWPQSSIVREFSFNRRLARIAAELMGCSGVRMYHDQALYKEPGGGITPWHADQYYWPLDTDNTVTAWIPLQATPMELGPLFFCAQSQNYEGGRGLEISDQSEQTLAQALKDRGRMVEEPFELGEVSFHSGWTYHRAGPNTSDRPRKVMTVIYVDENARVSPLKYKAHENDLAQWLPGLKVGDPVNSPLNPVLWSSRP